ncbi:hypothetical protein TNCV_2807931 [Trichonephila clavipes]|nr:hypothetical protein TNCV_2807931 [Trichonephila clavipes]
MNPDHEGNRMCYAHPINVLNPINPNVINPINVLRNMIRINPTLASTEVGFKLGIHQTTALDYIKRFGFVSEFSVWMRHKLSEKINRQYFLICSSHLACHEREPFLSHLVTGCEKWILYKHMIRKKVYASKRETSFTHIQSWHASEGYVGLLW